jgi:hypothetical protein
MAAAEVLEVRSLLSAGAAAVHQAAMHAAHAGELTPNTTLHPVVTPQLSAGGQTFTGPTATSFSISQPSVTPGAVVKMHAAFTIIIDAIPVSFKGSFSGKVLSSGPFLGGTKIEVTPTGGSLVSHFVEAGKKLTETFVPQGTVAEILLNSQGVFVDFSAAYVNKTHPGTPGVFSFS